MNGANSYVSAQFKPTEAQAMLDPAEVNALISKLCTDLGFCLPPEVGERLRLAPPADCDAFADAVFVAEGLDPRGADLISTGR
jgi:hypothetical protein